jgi:hypothetical protein
MKKINLFIGLFIIGLNSCFGAFDHDSLSVAVGSTSFSSVIGVPAESGLNLAISINRMHFDFSTNIINKNRSLSLGVANVGFIFPVSLIASIVPVLGVGFSDGDHSGSYHCDIIHTGNSTYYFNAGIDCLIKAGRHIGFYTGIGTFESFRVGIIFGFR